MNLDRKAIDHWIESLRHSPEAQVTVPADKGALSQFPNDATWHLGIYFTAFFFIPDDNARNRLISEIPRLFDEFHELTQGAMTHEQHPSTGKVLARGSKGLPSIGERFEAERDDVATITAFNEVTKESSASFHMDAACSFKAESRPGGPIAKFSYFKIGVPLRFWRQHRSALINWWGDALAVLQPSQAYSGLAFSTPPILERYPFFEPTEYALCQAFYGLDVDKPFFMRGSPYCEHKMHLELGTRTPTFGTLLRGKCLDQLGGEAAIRQALADDPQFHLTPCAGGLWIEAGDEPALFPVDQGIPRHYAKLARLMKPTRLESLWLISYLPPLPRDDCFNAKTSARWLKRFDDDGDWPSPEVRFWRPDNGSASPTPSTGRALPGEPAPRTGWWRALALDGAASRVYRLAGQAFPGPEASPRGRVVWQFDAVQEGPPPDQA